MTNLLRSSAVMAAGTVASRLTGVGRSIVIVAALGFFPVADAFALGNTLPNIIYILVIGGALNAVFVPQLVRHMASDADDGAGYADRLLTVVGVALLALSAAAVLFAPWIVDLYTPNDYDASQLDLATAFARYCLPQIFFYGLFTMLSQVLNARERFAMPMFAPIVNNAVAIATFGIFLVVVGPVSSTDQDLTSGQAALLGIGTTLGVAAQAAVLVPVLWRAGYHYRPRFDWRGVGLGKAGRLAAWTVGLVLVNQAAYVVVTRLATQANVDAAAAANTPGGLATYQTAHLIFILPHSVITVSVVTALLPALSRKAHERLYAAVSVDLGYAMRLVAAFIVPLAAVLVVTGPWVAELLFGYGAASGPQAELLGTVVSVFMLGLIPFTLFYVLLRGFYALEDTRTPFWLTVVLNAVNLALAVPLFAAVATGPAKIESLALAYVLAYWVALVVTWAVLARRLGGLHTAATVAAVARMALAAGVALAVMAGTQWGLRHAAWSGKVALLVDLVVVAAVGAASYLVAARVLRITEVGAVLHIVTRRLPGRARG
ncbi:MAG: murein biosynthesis integral membrane protein MurJ [Actinomycetota bacterium]|nr:MAG: murein biosynthesis integral membrane protein MurJ [Actinomycetota bacterium]